MRGGSEQCAELGDRAGGYYRSRRRAVSLDPFSDDLGPIAEAELADGMAEKFGALGSRLDKDDRTIADSGYDETGEARTAANVDPASLRISKEQQLG